MDGIDLHARLMGEIYQDVRFPEAIDRWAAHFVKDALDVAISNARHLDVHRQRLENSAWRQYIPSDGRVLDLGCGRGFFSNRLKESFSGRIQILGLDISKSILSIAKWEQSWLPLICGDGERLPLCDDTFDAILLISTLEHTQSNRGILAECRRALVKGGMVYLTIHKNWTDPFLFPSLYSRTRTLGGRCLRALSLKKKQQRGRWKYARPLSEVRASLKDDFAEYGFQFVESKPLIHTFAWGFYKRWFRPLVPALIRVGALLNRLPFSYYKNLEYQVWRKI